MNHLQLHSSRMLVVAALALALSSPSVASRVESATAPASAAVMSAPQQAAAAQADESASLRHGVITAIDERGSRLQVQGIWLEVAAARTQVVRNGEPAKVESLRVGDAIKFMVAPGTGEAQMLRVIYAP